MEKGAARGSFHKEGGVFHEGGLKGGSRQPRWFITKGVKRWVADNSRGSRLRRFLLNLGFLSSLRALLELLVECNKVDF